MAIPPGLPALLSLSLALAQAAAPPGAAPPSVAPLAVARPDAMPGLAILPLSQVLPGQLGVGRTVFAGDRIEEFEVEVLGVLANTSPRGSTILARLRGGPLAESGVIAGMSGSPVYVGGRLIGAVSSGYAFSKEPIAGITPIEDMIDLSLRDWGAEDGRSLYLAAPGELGESLAAIETGSGVRLLAGLGPAAGGGAGATTSIVPVMLSGFGAETYDLAAGFFRGLGLQPIQGAGVAAGGAGAGSAPSGAEALVAGAPVAIELIRGDLSVAAYGTVTAREGDRLLAFGHPLFSAGSVSFPLATASVVAVMPSLVNSFKLATLGETVGSLEQDRASGILGRIGGRAPVVPLTLGIKRGERPVESFVFELAVHRLLTPQLVELALLNTLRAREKLVGASSLEVHGRIEIAGERPVVLDHFFSGDSAAASAVGLVSMATQALLHNDFASADIKGITLTVSYLEDNRMALLDRIALDRARVRPGDTVRVKAFLRRLRGGEESVELALRVPPGLGAGPIDLLVGDAAAIGRFEARAQRYSPRTLGQLVELINSFRKSNAVYALLSRPDLGVVVKGSRLAALPPSAYALVAGNEAADGLLPVRRLALDEVSAATVYQVGGSKSLRLMVDGSAQ